MRVLNPKPRSLCLPAYRTPYDLDVARRVMMGIQELRLRLRERVSALSSGIHTVFTRHGRPVAVLVDVDWYQRAAEALGDEPMGFETVPPPRKKTQSSGEQTD